MELETISYRQGQGWSSELSQLDSEQTVVLVFGGTSYLDNSGPLEELARAYRSSHILGCSSSGEIFGTNILDDSLSVAVARFESTQVKSTCVELDEDTDAFSVGRKLARELDSPQLRGMLVFSDGLNVNGSKLVRGVLDVVDDDVVVNGGLAGDGDRFERTWVAFGGEVASERVAAVGFYGDSVDMRFGSEGGWDSFGPERSITRAEGNILYELDGQPALERYKKYLGEHADGLPANALLFPLSIRETRDSDHRLVRTILAVDEDEQSMTFAGDVPEGHYAQFMMAQFDRLIGGASSAGASASSKQEHPTLAVAISCVGRRMVLGERTEEEIEAVSEQLGEGASLVGFYSYGEISPTAHAQCDLHNQTMTLATITEIPQS